jgi:hypothetical protein
VSHCKFCRSMVWYVWIWIACMYCSYMYTYTSVGKDLWINIYTVIKLYFMLWNLLALSWSVHEKLCLSSIWIYCLIYVSCIVKCYECSPIWFTEFSLNLRSTRINRSTLIFWQTESADASTWKAHYSFVSCITGISNSFLSPTAIACLVNVTIFVIQNLKDDQHRGIN